MQLIEVYRRLKQLDVSVLLTSDVAIYLDISITHASKLLSRLAESKQLIDLTRNTWVFHDIDPLELPTYLTAPFPSYISLQTALYYHGMISQIPAIIYAVSLARTSLYKTPLATVSIHHLQPGFFFGYESQKNNAIKIATLEKAFIDFFYFSDAKSALFRSLPEVELPKNFKWNKVREMVRQIPFARKRTLVSDHLDLLQLKRL